MPQVVINLETALGMGTASLLLMIIVSMLWVIDLILSVLYALMSATQDLHGVGIMWISYKLSLSVTSLY